MNRDASALAPPTSPKVYYKYNMAVGYSTVTFLAELNSLIGDGWTISGDLQVSTTPEGSTINKLFAQLVYRTYQK